MDKRLELARIIAKEAGYLTLRYFYDHHQLHVEIKDDETPVTVADREAENLLRKWIGQYFPDDAIVGEELPIKKGTSPYRWFLDPIDGTKSFIHGVPLYSTLIGIEKDGKNVAGVICLPALNEMLWAGRGMGAWHETPRSREPKQAKVSECCDLTEALFLTSEVKTFDQCQRGETYKTLEKACRLTRTWGDAYGYVLVATGRADVMVDPSMSEWDAAPLPVILEEAGGKFTDWMGTPTIFGREGVACNGRLHDQVLKLTRAEG